MNKGYCAAAFMVFCCFYSVTVFAKGGEMFDFSQSSDASEWMVVNDGVMGGVSRSSMVVEDGTAHFSGHLSLENNGGFASVRRQMPNMTDTAYSMVTLRIKGDGRPYQLRIRTDSSWDGVSYRALFNTVDGEWTTITLQETDFTPVFRGRRVANAANFRFKDTKQFGFLLADKQAGKFHLEVSHFSFQ
ncbi:exported hypothetical protein [Vibrio nigripulchritudo SOn1]|uniref:NADH:ubiquinone oxidoreductase intermediate-associated protein 30 domain-containing protein n=2 Tax=Vibrio nigripulchritudo TaxID=28173 RepID=A0AAV2VXB3_9VIBR|nr:exported hypothetical protein [Vibrio nigripulchritudo SOn1]